MQSCICQRNFTCDSVLNRPIVKKRQSMNHSPSNALLKLKSDCKTVGVQRIPHYSVETRAENAILLTGFQIAHQIFLRGFSMWFWRSLHWLFSGHRKPRHIKEAIFISATIKQMHFIHHTSRSTRLEFKVRRLPRLINQA